MSRLRLPLAAQVLLWLLLNLLLLGGLGAVFVSGESMRELLLAVGAGSRLETLAQELAAELAEARRDERDTVLARFSADYDDLPFLLFSPGGAQVAGPHTPLPPELHERLTPIREGRRSPLAGRAAPPETGSAAPALPPLGRTAIVRTLGPAPRYWAVQRLPARRPPGLEAALPAGPRARLEAGGTPPGPVLVIPGDSLWALRSLVDLRPWLAAAGVVTLVSVLFWLPPVIALTRHVRALTRATEHIAEGDFDTRVTTTRGDELGRLGLAINRMTERLDGHLRGQKRFLADIAHELCSPLARLQMAVGILESRLAAGPAQAALADVRVETEEMAALVAELLAFSRASLRRRDLPLVSLDLAALTARVLAREDPTGLVRAAVPAGLHALGDAALLERALANLIRNTLRHAGSGAAPAVLASRGPATGPIAEDRRSSAPATGPGIVTLAVEDAGPGVPPETLPLLGEPFFRPDAARTRETGGTGLGLAIVRTCVEACRGRVVFSSRSPHGFRAALELVAAPAPSLAPAPEAAADGATAREST